MSTYIRNFVICILCLSLIFTTTACSNSMTGDFLIGGLVVYAVIGVVVVAVLLDENQASQTIFDEKKLEIDACEHYQTENRKISHYCRPGTRLIIDSMRKIDNSLVLILRQVKDPTQNSTECSIELRNIPKSFTIEIDIIPIKKVEKPIAA